MAAFKSIVKSAPAFAEECLRDQRVNARERNAAIPAQSYLGVAMRTLQRSKNAISFTQRHAFVLIGECFSHRCFRDAKRERKFSIGHAMPMQDSRLPNRFGGKFSAVVHASYLAAITYFVKPFVAANCQPSFGRARG